MNKITNIQLYYPVAIWTYHPINKTIHSKVIIHKHVPAGVFEENNFEFGINYNIYAFLSAKLLVYIIFITSMDRRATQKNIDK